MGQNPLIGAKENWFSGGFMGDESEEVRVGAVMEKNDHQKLAVEQLHAWLDDLYDRAYKIVEAHWAVVRATEQKMPGWENKSALQVRCARDGNAIKLEWARIKWIGSKTKGTRRAERLSIRKTGEYGYNLKTLLGFSKEWEKPLVEDTETKLTAIRREARHINKALQLIRFAKDARKAAMAADKKGDADAKSN